MWRMETLPTGCSRHGRRNSSALRQSRSSRSAFTGPTAEDIAKRRETLVLKPNDEYGGKGVVLGWTVDQAEWDKAIEVASTQSYVVQEAVEIPRVPFPVALDGLKFIDLAVDLDPYLYDGRAAGFMTRVSAVALLNVTAGAGSVVPTFVVEGTA